MNLLQFVYTSCRKGQSSGAGFQTFALSDGFTEEERIELERLSVYVPPNHLPPEPTAQEIKTLFPVSFSFFKLKSGRYGICRSSYLGRDYSGRFGNYFAHALIQQEGQFPCHPVLFWDAPFFLDRLSEAEQNASETPPLLPPLALEPHALPSNPALTFSVSSDFLQSQKDGLWLLTRQLTALLNHGTDRRRLIYCGPTHHILHWFAAIQEAFPLGLAHRITFNSYTHDPESSNALLCATTRKGGRFAFSQSQRDYEYYLFDFENGEHSQVEGTYAFTSLVSSAYEYGSQASLNSYNQFSNHFDNLNIDPAWDKLYNLYSLSQAGLEDLDQIQLEHALEFANHHGSPKALGMLSELLLADDGRVLHAVSDNVNGQSATTFGTFLFKIAGLTNELRPRQVAFQFFQTAFQALLFGPHANLDQALQFSRQMATLNRDDPAGFARAGFSLEHMKTLAESLLEAGRPEHAAAVLHAVFEAFTTAGVSWQELEKNDSWLHMIERILKILAGEPKQLTAILEQLDSDSRLMPGLYAHTFDSFADLPPIQQLLVQHLRPPFDGGDQALALRREILTRNGGELLFLEFNWLLEQSRDKVAFFHQYDKIVFENLIDFEQAYFTRAAVSYMETFENQSIKKAGPESAWLLNNPNRINKPAVFNRLFRICEASLDLDGKQTDFYPHLPNLLQLKKAHGIQTEPDMLRLIQLGRDIQAWNVSFPVLLERLKTVQPHLEKLNAVLYAQWLAWVLPSFLRGINQPEQFGDLITVLKIKGQVEFLAETWGKTLKNVATEKTVGLKQTERFLIYYLRDMGVTEKYMRPLIDPYLIGILARQGLGQLDRFENVLRNQKLLTRPSILQSWRHLKGQVEEKERNSLRGIVRRSVGFAKGLLPKRTKT